MATDHDRLVTAMGADVLKRKRDALLAHPSFVLHADDPKIIDMDLFENLDKACCTCNCVVYLFSCINHTGSRGGVGRGEWRHHPVSTDGLA